MIEVSMARVYLAPTRRRRYFSKESAIQAEAKAIIYKYFPPTHESNEYEGSYCTYVGEHFDVWDDSPEWAEKRYNQLCRALKNRLNNQEK